MGFRNCFIFDNRFWLDIIFPNRCAFCKEIIPWDDYSCESCAEKLPYIDKEICERCGKRICICESAGICYDRCYSVVWYEESIRNAVVRFKTESPENFAGFFGEKLAEKILKDNLNIDIVTSVPSSIKVLRQRGYNQASELGRKTAEYLKTPFYHNLLSKKNSAVKQHDLSMKERAEYVKGLYNFSGNVSVKGKSILLCDDIITTGSTLNACAAVLKENGARSVICAVAANTDYINNKNDLQ